MRTEIRNLGTGFYKFSLKEEERKKQMEDIKKIRRNAVEAREEILISESKKEAECESRRNKIYNIYKRSRMSEEKEHVNLGALGEKVDSFIESIKKLDRK